MSTYAASAVEVTLNKNLPRSNDAEHHNTHHDISDHALQIATHAILLMFVVMIAIAIFGMYLHR
ncbi:MAG: hypothetical protein ACKVP7_04410 [Hyphomicrobiaceae bacterium]